MNSVLKGLEALQDPRPIVDPSAEEQLTSRVIPVVNKLLPLMYEVARRDCMPVTKLELTGYVDPEDGTRELFVTQWIHTGPDVALDYWDRLGDAVTDLGHTLSKTQANILADRIAVVVRWERDDAAAGV